MWSHSSACMTRDFIDFSGYLKMLEDVPVPKEDKWTKMESK